MGRNSVTTTQYGAPAVSVIVPTYHREEELERALDTLAGQRFSDFDVVVVDDNGDARWNSRVDAVLERVREKWPGLAVTRICSPRTLGSAEARNAGIRAARGRYITFLDDDDEYLPEKIRRQMAFMEDNALDFSITDLELYYTDGRLSERRQRSYIRKTDPKSLLEYHFMHHMTGTDTIMFSRDYLTRIGGFPGIDVGDEFYLMERAIRTGGRFGYLPGCDVRAYVHTGTGGLSSGEGKIRGENMLYEHKKQFFSAFSRKIIRHIRMRHYCVLAFAGLRMRNWGYFLKWGVMGFCSAPVQCVRMLVQMHK